jgi:hypothetical protein
MCEPPPMLKSLIHQDKLVTEKIYMLLMSICMLYNYNDLQFHGKGISPATQGLGVDSTFHPQYERSHPSIRKCNLLKATLSK